MTLGIDLRCLPADGSAGGGIAHAARAITDAIIRSRKGSVVCYVPNGAMISAGVPVVWIQDGRRASLIGAMRTTSCDLLFVPSGAISPGLPVPAVPWVHDVDIFDHPEWFPQGWWKRQLTTQMFLHGIRHASYVFAVSEYTKCTIERLDPSVVGKVTVTGEGGDQELASIREDQLPEVKAAAQTRLAMQGILRRFVLVLGTLEPRKNIPLACRIWPEVAKAAPDVDLVIAGRDGWKTDDINAAIRSTTPAPLRLPNVTEALRRDLLLGAEAVLVPSFSEGFGLVALEAIQAGTPALVSNGGALPEVVGHTGLILHPEDEVGWRDEIISILTNPSPLEQGVSVQRRNLSHFSWDNVAGVTQKSFYL